MKRKQKEKGKQVEGDDKIINEESKRNIEKSRKTKKRSEKGPGTKNEGKEERKIPRRKKKRKIRGES